MPFNSLIPYLVPSVGYRGTDCVTQKILYNKRTIKPPGELSMVNSIVSFVCFFSDDVTLERYTCRKTPYLGKSIPCF